MNMSEWAKREVEIACKKCEVNNADDIEVKYSQSCMVSALKAFESLCEDDHSGMSIHITQNILNRLIDGKTLTPIEDTDDTWGECLSTDGEKLYQCKRMSSLFKRIDEDGNVTYSDNSRCCMREINSDTTWHSGLIMRIYDEMFPISFPYNAPNKRDEVVCTEFLTDRANGDFDTVGVLYINHNNGEQIPVYRYFKESENGWDEISMHEYNMRRKKHYARIDAEKAANK